MAAAETPSLRHLLVRVAATLLALVVLYALSAGPASYVAVKCPGTVPRLVMLYGPLRTVLAWTRLQKPFHAYVDLWSNAAGGPVYEM